MKKEKKIVMYLMPDGKVSFDAADELASVGQDLVPLSVKKWNESIPGGGRWTKLAEFSTQAEADALLTKFRAEIKRPLK